MTSLSGFSEARRDLFKKQRRTERVEEADEMSGRRLYGESSTATVLIQNDCIPTQGIDFEALLCSSSSPSGFHGSRSMVNFEDFQGNAPNGAFYHPLDMKETGDDDLDEYFQQPEKKRRLTVNQVQSLEKTFEIENKLEPERKARLARDLGLHPRQVAIWFQNRRARWKTKQLEKDYEALKSSYNMLKSDYEELLMEKEKLKSEVLVLTDKLLAKEKGNTDAFEPNNAPHMILEPIPDSVSGSKRSDGHIVVCKQEDVSSEDSAVSNSDSPRCADGGQASLYELADSSNAFEVDQSDHSYVEENKEVKGCNFLKLEDNPCNYGFPVEDQAFWFWPY